MAGLACGQSPFAIAPSSYHLDFENEYVRIVRVTLAPHGNVPTHAHPETPTIYVYTQDGGPIRFSHTGGIVMERPAVHQGQIRFGRGNVETHSVQNLSDRPNNYLRVELKTETDVAHLHNSRVNAGDAFENSMVRITRRPGTVSSYRAVDVDYASGRGVWREPGEAGPVPDVRIELKTNPAMPPS